MTDKQRVVDRLLNEEEEPEECEHAEVIKKGDKLYCEICEGYLDETEYD